MIEPFGPEYVRPAQPDCPNCRCCTAALCERGRASVHRCSGFTSAELIETVYGCPCSSATTPGTHAWRADRVRVTRYATEHPLPPDVEVMLRTLAEGGNVEDPQTLARLRVIGFAAETDEGAQSVTESGRLYLAARSDQRFVTPVEVLSVDVKARTASVGVVCWRGAEPVTVLLDQLTAHTGLSAEELPGTWLEAEANCGAAKADDVVLTRISIAPPLPDSTGDETIALRTLEPNREAEEPAGRVDGAPQTQAPAGGETPGGDA